MLIIILAEVTGISVGKWSFTVDINVMSHLEVSVASFPVEMGIWVLRISHTGLRAELWETFLKVSSISC